MKHKNAINIFGLIEVSIGLFTLSSLITSLILGISRKPPGVLIFVLAAAFISFGLGIGILKRTLSSYHLILFFSSVIVISKALIFAGVIHLSGALETSVPSSLKNAVSLIYHISLILYFIRPGVRKEFGEKRNVLFSLKLPF